MEEQNTDMNTFMATEQPQSLTETANPEKKNRKKRKKPYNRDDDHDMVELRKKAKSLCSCYEQYKSISKYKKDRLKDWIEQKSFDKDAALRNNIFDFVHRTYAAVMDIVSKGEGYVKERLENDISLRTAIEDEGRDLVKYLSNKTKILVLSTTGVCEGKIQQKLEKKDTNTVQIEEIKQHGNKEEQVPTNSGDYQTTEADSHGETDVHIEPKSEAAENETETSEKRTSTEEEIPMDDIQSCNTTDLC